METTLADFIHSYDAKPWAPGRVDCCLMLASWAIWLGHRDPAEHLRGTYDSDEGFRAIIEAADGVVPIVEACTGLISGRRVVQPSCGDIGVVGSSTNIHRQFGAIFDGARWRVRFIGHVGTMVARPLAIWRI